MKHKKKNNKILPVFLLFLLLIAALLVILVVAGGEKEKKPAVSTESTEDTSSDTDKWQEGVISYNGKNYLSQSRRFFHVAGIFHGTHRPHPQ